MIHRKMDLSDQSLSTSVNYKEGKAAQQNHVCKKMCLASGRRGRIMLIGMVSRMTDQKGFDLDRIYHG